MLLTHSLLLRQELGRPIPRLPLLLCLFERNSEEVLKLFGGVKLALRWRFPEHRLEDHAEDLFVVDEEVDEVEAVPRLQVQQLEGLRPLSEGRVDLVDCLVEVGRGVEVLKEARLLAEVLLDYA